MVNKYWELNRKPFSNTSEKALYLVYERSKGIPRIINNIAQIALFVGFTQRSQSN